LTIPVISPTNRYYNSVDFMSLGFESVKNCTFRFSLIAALVALSGEVAAIGLGELRGKPALGDKPRFELDILGAGAGSLDAGCFQLKQPAGDDSLPWLKQATFSVRRGNPAVLEIRSSTPLSDPVLGVAVYVSCGHDMVREYVVFASPPTGGVVDVSPPLRAPATTSAPRRQVAAVRPATVSASSAPVSSQLAEQAKLPVAQGSPAPAEDKIKSMEATVGELQQRAADLTQRIEQAAATPPAGQAVPPEAKPVSPAPVQAAAPSAPAAETKSGGSGWSLYGALFGALLAVAAWLGWRSYSQRRQEAGGAFGAPDVVVDPQRMDEHEERGGVDLQMDPVAMVTPAKLDVSAAGAQPAMPGAGSSSRLDSVMSISAATVDEHFEANPVMELAEIMLSFGRVKGAAQALQEYIDANPQEALKPWIRLMDVYRMAGMRHEFERVARELNKNFNVEIQKWELPAEEADTSVDVVLDADHSRLASRPDEVRVEGVESMPAIMEQVLMRWPEGDVIGYLNQLLRDNRGGTRIGFALPVVSDILFLIDLKEVAKTIEGESAAT
jgi:pilus assembly protein FimV